jgi:hypothetical protein
VSDRHTTRQGQARWQGRPRNTGGERHSHSGFPSEAQADADEETTRTSRRPRDPLRANTTMTIDAYWERWWTQEVTVARAHATQRSYRDTYTG